MNTIAHGTTSRTGLVSRRVKSLLALLLIVMMSILCSPGVLADLRVAPVELYLSNENPMGRIIVENRSDGPREIEVRFRFGYPVSNEQGDVTLYYADSSSQDSHSAAHWIRAYPRRLVLQPGQQQTVRFAARPPARLSEGEYWVRASISSRPLANDVENPDSQKSSVTTHLHVAFNTVIAVVFRQGKIDTGVELLAGKSSVANNKVRVLVDLKRSGNGAYRGNLVGRLRTADGRIIKTAKSEVAVYYQLRRAIDFDSSGLARGSYTVEVEANTDRQGTSPTDIVKAALVSKSFDITVP